MSKTQKKKPAAKETQGATEVKAEASPKAAAPTGTPRRWVWPGVIVLVVAGALLVSQTLFGNDAVKPSTPWALTILHTTDVEGYLDPCG